jgi:hypothetical protein
MALAVGDLRAIIVRTVSVNGVLAQLVERLNGIEEVRGSSPLGSMFLIWSELKNHTAQLTHPTDTFSPFNTQRLSGYI